jgi:integrase
VTAGELEHGGPAGGVGLDAAFDELAADVLGGQVFAGDAAGEQPLVGVAGVGGLAASGELGQDELVRGVGELDRERVEGDGDVLQAVRPTTLSGLYRDLLVHGGKEARPLSRATVDYVHAILRKAFNDAVRSEQLLVTNPAERAKRPRGGPRGLREVWTAEQLRTFLNAASHHRLSAFFPVAAYTGARRGEVSNLRWADIDWDAPALRIKGSVGIIAGQRVEGTTKSGRERLVSLDTGTVEVLRALRRSQVENQLALGDAWTETGHVFTSGDGVPINPDSMTALMAKTIRAHNAALPPEVPALPVARLHDLRHVHATHLLLAGVPVHVVAGRLGHADPAITLRVYAHVLRQHAAGVADVSAAAIKPGPGAAALLARPLASPDCEPENPRSLSL